MPQKGHLIVIGGAESRRASPTILQRFVELSGGDSARIVVITTASSYMVECEKAYTDAFLAMGASEVVTLHIVDRPDANAQACVDAVYGATGVFMTGGDQSRLASILGGSEVGKAMHRAFKKGLCIAGTSAGASAVSEHMIAGGKRGLHPRKGMFTLMPGLGLLKRVVIDQHFTQRHRLGRLLSIVAHNPFLLGIGIDENTAIVVAPDTTFEVVGNGVVTVVDGRNLVHSNVNHAKRNQLLGMHNLVMHILPQGYRYLIETRVPGPAPDLPALELEEPPAPVTSLVAARRKEAISTAALAALDAIGQAEEDNPNAASEGPRAPRVTKATQEAPEPEAVENA